MGACLPLVCALAAVFALGGCGGTETGNPGTGVTTDESLFLAAVPTSAARLGNAICAKLVSCNPSLTISACRLGLLSGSSIDTELGLSAGYGTGKAVILAEQAGVIVAREPGVTNCLNEVAALACGSGAVQGAYSVSAPADFSNLWQIIPATPGSCPAFF